MKTKLIRHPDGQRICVCDELQAPVVLKCACPKCGAIETRDFRDGAYVLGEWTTGVPFMVEFFCPEDECDHNWEIPVRIVLDMELDQDGWFPAAEHQRAYQAVNLILWWDPKLNEQVDGEYVKGGDKILMLRRQNTGWQDGKLNLPAGHLDWGESPLKAAIREAQEELGIALDPETLRVVCVIHQNLSDGRGYIDYFVECRNGWEGKPRNAEENKSKEIVWVEAGYWMANNGKDMTDIAREGLEAWESGIPYKELPAKEEKENA